MTFDYSRIKDFPNKKLLKWNVDYFNAFMSADAALMRDFQAENFYITDIPLGIVRVNRDQWYNINAEFTSNTYDSVCTALTLDGFYNRKYSVTILENHITFKMKHDYPDNSGQYLPPNLKAGDSASMIMCSIIWWDENGKVLKDLEYGRLPWNTFSLDPWDGATGPPVASSGSEFLSTLLQTGADDDDMSLVKEDLPLPGLESSPKRKSLLTRAKSWIATLFRL